MAIVVGYVPSPEGRAALDSAIAEARLRGQRLVVVNTTRGDALVDSKYTSTDEWSQVQEQLADSGIDHEVTRSVETREPAEQLLHVARTTNADLIVIGLRRRTPVGKLIMGSAAQTILLEADCPVLAVKAPR
jgi:nucleotide-binding universal stress UspA family protein